MKHNINAKITHHLRTLISASILSALVFCAEYNNPVDPAYKGDYDFSADLSDTLEIFKQYDIEIKDNGKDHYDTFTLDAPENGCVPANIKLNDKKLKLYFYKIDSSKLFICGIRPNGKKDIKTIELKVKNPYIIKGDSVIAKNNPAQYFIKHCDNDDSISKSIKNVHWFYNNNSSITKIDSFFTTRSEHTDSAAQIKAKIIDTNDSSFTVQKQLKIEGYALKITSILISDSNKTNNDTVTLGNPLTICVSVFDQDSSDYYITILKDSTDTIKKSNSVIRYDSLYSQNNILIIDTGNIKLNIKIKDEHGYIADSQYTFYIKHTLPKVFIKDTLEIQYDDPGYISFDSTKNGFKFEWQLINLSNNYDTIADTTSDSLFHLSPRDTLDTLLLKVRAIDKYKYKGPFDSAIVIFKNFTYTIKPGGFYQHETCTISVRKPYTLLALLYKNNIEVTESKSFEWNFTPNIIKEYATFSPDNDTVILNFTDSIPPFSFKVKGRIGSEYTKELSAKVIVRKYRPFCIYERNKDSMQVKMPKTFKITAFDTPDSTPLAVYYKKLRPETDTSAYIYDTSNGFSFNVTGNIPIIFWTVDKDGFYSDTITDTVTITSSLPYINIINDTITAIVKDSVKITGVTANPNNYEGSIDSCFWSINNDTLSTKTTDISLPPYTQPGLYSISIWCTDTFDKISIPAILYIKVLSDIPSINSVIIHPDTKYINKNIKVIIYTTDPDDSILTIDIDTNNVSMLTKDIKTGVDSLNKIFNSAGEYQLRFRAKDSNGNYSEYHTCKVTIDKGIPYINSIKTDTSTIYINDKVQFRIDAKDNDSIKSWIFAIDNKADSTVENDSVFETALKASGNHVLFSKVNDNDGNFSDWKPFNFTVFLGLPVINKIESPKEIFINQPGKFFISGFDTNGVINQLDISWNGDTIAESVKTFTPARKEFIETIIHTFEKADTGKQMIYFRIHDDDGLKVWDSVGILVKKGEPQIDTILLERFHDTIYVLDSIEFSIFVTDSNSDSEKQIKVSWNGDTLFEDSIKVTKNHKFKHSFNKEDTVVNKIRFRVIDNDSFYADKLYSINIKSGAPVVKSFKPDTVWVNDNNPYTITASDTNGYIVNYRVDWANNGIWDDSATTNRTFPKSWDTTFGDKIATCKVLVMDDDGLKTSKVCSVFVRMGRPEVKGGANYGLPIQWKADTMFYIYSGGNSTFAVDKIDLNGVIQMFYWDIDRDGINDSTTVPTWSQYLPQNTATPFRVTAKDDDSIKSLPFDFYVFPDAPPPATTTTSDASQGVRIIMWSGKDAKDGQNTLYKIVAKVGTASALDSVTFADESNPAYIVSDYKTGAQYEKGNAYDFKYTYTPNQGNGIYHYRIIARDARGSVSRTGGDPQFSF